MSSNLRSFGKIGFVLVLIGFFMPVACDANGLSMMKDSSVDTGLRFALFGLLATAVVGIILGILLLKNTKIPIFLDWLVLVVCFCCGFIPFFYYIKNRELYQTGVYVMLSGIVVSLICQLVTPNKRET
jgi:hypothetical protein